MTGEPDPGQRPSEVPADGHAGDLVSAYVDGELDPRTATWVAGHVEACEPCRRAADDARAAKEALRSLPAVDGGPAVEGFLARHRAAIRTGSAFVGIAAVALGALALSSAVLHPAVVPDVDAMVAAHVATTGSSRGVSDPSASAADVMATVRPVDRVAGNYAAPPAVAGARAQLQRHAMFDGPDLTVVVYGDGQSAVSVFQQPGALQWDDLPPGSVEEFAGRRAWRRDARPTVVVSEVGDLVITLVSDDLDALDAIAGSLPEKERGSAWERLHDACMRFASAFTAS